MKKKMLIPLALGISICWQSKINTKSKCPTTNNALRMKIVRFHCGFHKKYVWQLCATKMHIFQHHIHNTVDQLNSNERRYNS